MSGRAIALDRKLNYNLIVLLFLICYFLLKGYATLHTNLAWATLGKSVMGDKSLLEGGSEAMESDSAIRLDATTIYFAEDCETASERLDQAIEFWPYNVVIKFFSGNAYYQCGHVDQAIARWHEAKAAPYFFQRCEQTWHQYYHRECQEAVCQDYLKDVVEYCEIAVAIDPSVALAFNYLGSAYTHLGQYSQAAQAFEEAIKQDDSIPGVYLRAGSAFERSGQLRLAEQYLRLAIEQAPTDARGYYGLGKLCLEQHRYAEAEEYLKEAIGLDDQQASYFLTLGDLYCSMRDIRQAEAAYRQSLNLLPSDAAITEKVEKVEDDCR